MENVSIDLNLMPLKKVEPEQSQVKEQELLKTKLAQFFVLSAIFEHIL